MGYTAYQLGAYQTSGYQIDSLHAKGGGGRVHDYTNSFEQSRWKWEKDEQEKNKLEVKLNKVEVNIKNRNIQIDKIQEQRLQDLTNTKLQLQLVRLAKEAEEQRLQLEYIQEQIKVIEMFWLREEEDIMAILYSLPFC